MPGVKTLTSSPAHYFLVVSVMFADKDDADSGAVPVGGDVNLHEDVNESILVHCGMWK